MFNKRWKYIWLWCGYWLIFFIFIIFFILVFSFLTSQTRIPGPLKTTGTRNKGAHAYAMLHYKDLQCPPGHSFAGGICAKQPIITGLGECAWCIREGLESYAAVAVESRQYDIAYIAGWDLLNYWPNFLAGMSYAKHAWKQQECVYRDRVDGVDGWNSSVVEWVQKVQ